MSAPEFLPGDRVSIGGGPLTLVVDEAVPMIEAGTRVLAEHGHLVSRPVYPNAGEVVVALDAQAVAAIEAGAAALEHGVGGIAAAFSRDPKLGAIRANERAAAASLRAILDRAREAAR